MQKIRKSVVNSLSLAKIYHADKVLQTNKQNRKLIIIKENYYKYSPV